MVGSIETLSGELRDGGRQWLLLFDIDGTLLDTGGKGLRALSKTAQETFRGECPPLDLAGSTDLGVLEYLCLHFETELSDELAHGFFERYHRNLDESLVENATQGNVLDGVVGLLDEFSSVDHLRLGLLTGNTMSGAFIKLQYYGLDRYFKFGAFGSDRADRNQLGRIALERAYAFTGRMHSVAQTLVIGDTPKDIACARAMGAPCLAVATGRFSKSELELSGAEWVVDSLLEI